ncbi:hypothetical protein [Actinosynnema sp. ALI-1.44]|nr:hypothetical protein [Actinosynnema sp. ALI-1.44]
MKDAYAESLRVDSIIDTLRAIDATDQGAESLAAAQAGTTWPEGPSSGA